jgi:8-oxo-dGTP pyrophosphatase MutT (NUDIX family)
MFNNSDRVYGCILQSPDNTYLLVEGRQSGKWSFPKGHPNTNETPLDCAKRELLEETGLVAPFMYSKEYILATGIYYLYKTRMETGCSIQDCNEISNTKWVTSDEMRGMSVNIDVNTFLRKLNQPTKKYKTNVN